MVAMGSATVFESMHGTEQALAVFYRSWWFETLLVLFGINLLVGMGMRYPFPRRQIGFVLAHGGLVAILAGALVTSFVGVDGSLSIWEGSTADSFSVGEDALILRHRIQNEKKAEIALVGNAFAGFEPVDSPDAPVLRLGDIEARVLRYLPDAVFAEQIVNDNPRIQPAVQVVLNEQGAGAPVWILAEQTEQVGSASATFRVIRNREAMDRLLEVPKADDEGAAAMVRIAYEGATHEIPLAECLDQAVPVGQTGYGVRVLRYLPHATVGQGGKITNASDRPLNPAIEAELEGPNGKETRIAFAKYPEFQSMHGGGDENVKLTFVTGAAMEPTTPIEVIAGPEGGLFARFSSPGNDPQVQALKVGEPLNTPWPGAMFTVLQRFDHARKDWTAIPAEPIRQTRQPAVLLELKTPNHLNQMWLGKYRSHPLTIDGQPFDMIYRNKTVPLDFKLTLDRFHVGYYPGTGRPRSFESHITIEDPTRGTTQSRVISMNHPVKFAGYTLYQSSYRQTDGRSMSVLSVARDPGQWIVFAGYVLTFVGLLVVLGIRMADGRNVRGSEVSEGDATERLETLATARS
jgi:hypothetical protein